MANLEDLFPGFWDAMNSISGDWGGPRQPSPDPTQGQGFRDELSNYGQTIADNFNNGPLGWLYSMIPDSRDTRDTRKVLEAQKSLADSEAKTKSMFEAKQTQHSQSQTDTIQALQQLLAQSHGAAPQDVFAAHGDAPVMRGGGDQGMSMGAYSKSLRPVSQQGFIQNHKDMGLDPQTLSLLAEVQDNPSSPILGALMELLQAHQEQNRAVNTRDILESKGSPQTAALLLKLLLEGKL